MSPDTAIVASSNYCSEPEKLRKTSNDTLAIGTPEGGESFTASSCRGDRLIVLFEHRKVTMKCAVGVRNLFNIRLL